MLVWLKIRKYVLRLSSLLFISLCRFRIPCSSILLSEDLPLICIVAQVCRQLILPAFFFLEKVFISSSVLTDFFPFSLFLKCHSVVFWFDSFWWEVYSTFYLCSSVSNITGVLEGEERMEKKNIWRETIWTIWNYSIALGCSLFFLLLYFSLNNFYCFIFKFTDSLLSCVQSAGEPIKGILYLWDNIFCCYCILKQFLGFSFDFFLEFLSLFWNFSSVHESCPPFSWESLMC